MSTQLGSLRRFLSTTVPRLGAEGHERAVVVASGRGGSGTTTLAALLALVAAADGRRTLLVETDRGLSILPRLLGCESSPGLGALREGHTPFDLMIAVTKDLYLLSCATPFDGAEIAPSAAEWQLLFRRVVGCYDDFDLVVIDGGSRLVELHGGGLFGASRLVAVSAADQISLAAGHALLKACTGHHPGLRTGVVINRCEIAEARSAYEVLREGVGRFLARSVAFGGVLPEEPSFRHVIEQGSTIQEAARDSELADAARDLAQRIIPPGALVAPSHVATR